MITKESAVNDHEWHLNGCARIVGPRGGEHVTCKVVRRNGRTQVWKRSPERFSLPVKYGMYEAFRIDEADSARFHSVDACPLRNCEYLRGLSEAHHALYCPCVGNQEATA